MVGMNTVREPIKDCLTKSLVLSKIDSCRSINPDYFTIIFVTIWFFNPAQGALSISLKERFGIVVKQQQQGMCLIVLFLAKSMHAKYMPSTINHSGPLFIEIKLTGPRPVFSFCLYYSLFRLIIGP